MVSWNCSIKTVICVLQSLSALQSLYSDTPAWKEFLNERRQLAEGKKRLPNMHNWTPPFESKLMKIMNIFTMHHILTQHIIGTIVHVLKPPPLKAKHMLLFFKCKLTLCSDWAKEREDVNKGDSLGLAIELERCVLFIGLYKLATSGGKTLCVVKLKQKASFNLKVHNKELLQRNRKKNKVFFFCLRRTKNHYGGCVCIPKLCMIDSRKWASFTI